MNGSVPVYSPRWPAATEGSKKLPEIDDVRGAETGATRLREMVYNDGCSEEDGKTLGLKYSCLSVLALSLGVAAVAPASAGTLPPQPQTAAPLGLRFGMTPHEVTLPAVVAPVTPWVVARPRTAPVAAQAYSSATTGLGDARAVGAEPVVLFAPGKTPAVPVLRLDRTAGRSSTKAPVPPQRAPTQSQGWAVTYIRACEAAFDFMANLGNRSERWRAWQAKHMGAGEGADFGDFIAERARNGTYRDSAELASELGARRAGGLYRFDPADARRVACLLFTADGLAQVFIAGPALDGLRDEVIARLEQRADRADLATFALTREAERFSLTRSRPACGLYCRVFGERLLVERSFWLDKTSLVLTVAKRYATLSGLALVFANDATGRELADGLPDSFLVYSDLGRRGRLLQDLMIEPATAAASAVIAPSPGLAKSPSTTEMATAGDRRALLIGSLLP